jgi:hypothetical protein
VGLSLFNLDIVLWPLSLLTGSIKSNTREKTSNASKHKDIRKERSFTRRSLHVHKREANTNQGIFFMCVNYSVLKSVLNFVLGTLSFNSNNFTKQYAIYFLRKSLHSNSSVKHTVMCLM